jgi:hypothetical protein
MMQSTAEKTQQTNTTEAQLFAHRFNRLLIYTTPPPPPPHSTCGLLLELFDYLYMGLANYQCINCKHNVYNF